MKSTVNNILNYLNSEEYFVKDISLINNNELLEKGFKDHYIPISDTSDILIIDSPYYSNTINYNMYKYIIILNKELSLFNVPRNFKVIKLTNFFILKKILFLTRIRNFFRKKDFCPICNIYLYFPLFSEFTGFCPICGSYPRHRLLFVSLQKKDIKDNDYILHIAPEECFSYLKKYTNYTCGDITKKDGQEIIDITNIQYKNDTFDYIICSHVLEHIIDDKKAIKELYRVLKPNGIAFIMVPIFIEKTFEDYSIVTLEERLKIFWHPEHVRNCGKDYIERIKEVGFEVSTTLDKRKKLFKYNDILYECTKKDS